MDYTTLIGIVGASVILVGFLLNQTGKVTAQSWSYDAVNVLGSLLLLIYAYLLGSVPFLILNVVWLLVSAKGVLKSNKKQP